MAVERHYRAFGLGIYLRGISRSSAFTRSVASQNQSLLDFERRKSFDLHRILERDDSHAVLS